MSVTPISSEQCGHMAPMVIEPTVGEYTARCMKCRIAGPVRASSGEARWALLELGRRSRRR